MRFAYFSALLLLFVSIYLQVEAGNVTLYYFSVSPNARTADLLAHGIDLPVNHHVVNLMNGQQFTPEFLKVNPLHTIPAIDDNGFIVWDSHAIMMYLVHKYGKDDSLYPKDLQKRAAVDQLLFYSNDMFYSSKLFMEAMNANNTKAMDFLTTYAMKHQHNMEKLLQNKKFLAGENLTIADYSFINIIGMVQMISPPEGKFPLTEKWIERCKGTMKNFVKVNKEGSTIFENKFKEKIASAKKLNY